MAAENGYVEVIRALAEHGADLNTPNQDGVSPVLVAANEGHSDVIKLLYKLGADMKPHFKWSMKDLAEKNDQAEAVQCIDRILAKLTNECECCGRSSKRLKKCSKCEKVRYCSLDCQKQDHQKHKHEAVCQQQPLVAAVRGAWRERGGCCGAVMTGYDFLVLLSSLVVLRSDFSLLNKGVAASHCSHPALSAHMVTRSVPSQA